MADPVSLSTLAMTSTGGSALGGVVSAVGSIFGGLSKSSMYNYQAGVAAVNQKIAKQNADYSRAVGEVQAATQGMKTRQEIGGTKVAQSASGFQVSGGSAEKVRESEHDVGSFEQAMIRSNAAKAAYGHEVEAINYGAQSKMYSMSAKSAKIGGFIGAASSILGGASSVSDKWLQYNQNFSSKSVGDPTVLGGLY